MVAAASAMGILVPPCILMIVIGAIANVSVAVLFVGGFLPALVLALAIMGYIYYDARRGGLVAAAGYAPARLAKLRHALIPSACPSIIFGGILGGVFTPTERRRSRCFTPGSSGSSSIARSSGPICRASYRQCCSDRQRLLPARRRGGGRLDAGGRQVPAGARGDAGVSAGPIAVLDPDRPACSSCSAPSWKGCRP